MIDGGECPSPTAPIRSVASVRHSDPPSCPAFIFVFFFSSDQVAMEPRFSKKKKLSVFCLQKCGTRRLLDPVWAGTHGASGELRIHGPINQHCRV